MTPQMRRTIQKRLHIRALQLADRLETQAEADGKQVSTAVRLAGSEAHIAMSSRRFGFAFGESDPELSDGFETERLEGIET